MRVSGTYTHAQTGTHCIGVRSAGLARVLVDGGIVADVWTNWTKGRTFFEEGYDEVHLESGRAHRIEVQFAARISDNIQV